MKHKQLIFAEFLKGVFLVFLIATLITTIMVFSECKSDICYISQGEYEPITMSFRQRLLSELKTWPLVGALGLGLLAGGLLAQRKSDQLLK